MYEGLPIVTNKIPITERHSIPHHLLGCINLNEQPWTVAQFKARAAQIVEDVRLRGKLPILVGGTHYYVQSLLFKDALVESSLEFISSEEQENRWPVLSANPEEMLEELRKVDPVMAARWHPKEVRKIRRSLEIFFSTGQKASEVYKAQRERREGIASEEATGDGLAQDFSGQEHRTTIQRADIASDYEPLIFCTYASPERLRSRLEDRVNTMLKEGLLAEVESMYNFHETQVSTDSVLDQSRGIWTAIGYKEFLPYLLAVKAGDACAKDLERLKLEGIERTQSRTRQYAKSQVKWIKCKLLPALRQCNMHERFYLLDATDLSKWQANVQTLANQTTTAFLNGSNLPRPPDLAGTAIDALRTREEQTFNSRHCSVCNKTMMTEDAWNLHLQSKKHRATDRKKKAERLALSEDW